MIIATSRKTFEAGCASSAIRHSAWYGILQRSCAALPHIWNARYSYFFSSPNCQIGIHPIRRSRKAGSEQHSLLPTTVHCSIEKPETQYVYSQSRRTPRAEVFPKQPGVKQCLIHSLILRRCSGKLWPGGVPSPSA